jgi:hypothetical protein
MSTLLPLDTADTSVGPDASVDAGGTAKNDEGKKEIRNFANAFNFYQNLDDSIRKNGIVPEDQLDNAADELLDDLRKLNHLVGTLNCLEIPFSLDHNDSEMIKALRTRLMEDIERCSVVGRIFGIDTSESPPNDRSLPSVVPTSNATAVNSAPENKGDDDEQRRVYAHCLKKASKDIGLAQYLLWELRSLPHSTNT